MIIHFTWSRKNIPTLIKRPTIGAINGVPLNIRESLDDINGFIEYINKHSRRSNMAQSWGYTAGGIASIIALILSFRLL
jgi:hypothetical protein